MLKEGQPVFERVSCEPHRPITGCRNRTGHRTGYMTTATTMAADVLAHLPPRKRLKVAAQIPTTATDEPPAHVSLLLPLIGLLLRASAPIGSGSE